MNREHLQLDYGLRFDWGLPGAKAIGADADIAVVVDVLSFTTTLTVALDAGVDVLPYRWNDDSAERYARASDAVLAVGRGRATNGQISLSPNTIRRSDAPRRLVLPSPTGRPSASNSAPEPACASERPYGMRPRSPAGSPGTARRRRWCR